jgi:hypothetical protein
MNVSATETEPLKNGMTGYHEMQLRTHSSNDEKPPLCFLPEIGAMAPFTIKYSMF